MRAALNEQGKIVYAQAGIAMNTKASYWCPHCLQPVKCCSQQNGHYYFRHVTEITSDGETAAHQRGKEEMWACLVKNGIAAELEEYEPAIDQRPDIRFTWQQEHWVIEYQCSVISIETLKERTESMESIGKTVWWILGEKFIHRKLTDMTLYCMRYHPKLGNFLVFYCQQEIIIHHHIQQTEKKRLYTATMYYMDVEKMDWNELIQLYKESTVIQAVTTTTQQSYLSQEELQLLMVNPQAEIRQLMYQLYCDRILLQELPQCCLQKPKYTWGFKSLRLVWQTRLWLGLRKLEKGTLFTTKQCLGHLKKLDGEGSIRMSTCYHVEEVCLQEIELFLRQLSTIELMEDGRWKISEQDESSNE